MSAGVHLRGLSTVVPRTELPQAAVRDVFAAQPGLNRLAQRIISELSSEAEAELGHDSSTNNLICYYRRLKKEPYDDWSSFADGRRRPTSRSCLSDV